MNVTLYLPYRNVAVFKGQSYEKSSVSYYYVCAGVM